MAHAEDAMTVARAADIAADGLSSVKARLYDLRDAAWRAGMQIDPVTSTVLPGPRFRGNATEAALTAARLQPHVDAVVAEANAIGAELAQAITTSPTAIATGVQPLSDGIPGGIKLDGEEGTIRIGITTPITRNSPSGRTSRSTISRTSRNSRRQGPQPPEPGAAEAPPEFGGGGRF